ncbi:MAG: hypothetical protein A4E58_02048 [Syntrophorhabdus sp. PtaB.Bin006]|nr:MAG: hypothetical protein A4E58_02048 [Syntrophorhabdus sp. PtaB.Bin006]
MGSYDADTVRPHDPHTVLLLTDLDLILEIFAFFPYFFKSCRNYDDPFHARFAAVLDHCRYCFCRGGNHSEINMIADLSYVGETLFSHDGLSGRIHREDLRGFRAEKVFEKGLPDRTLFLISANKGNCFRIKHCLDITPFHREPPSLWLFLPVPNSTRPREKVKPYSTLMLSCYTVFTIVFPNKALTDHLIENFFNTIRLGADALLEVVPCQG